MKKFKLLTTNIGLGFSLALAAALFAWLPGTSFAAEQMKGGPHMRHLMAIDNPAQAEDLKPGDSIAMACSKCKSVMIHNVTTEKGHIKVMTVGEKHLCPGCGSTITVVGTGKDKHDAVKHVCEKCGDDSVYCCATKPGSGAKQDMHQK